MCTERSDPGGTILKKDEVLELYQKAADRRLPKRSTEPVYSMTESCLLEFARLVEEAVLKEFE